MRRSARLLFVAAAVATLGASQTNPLRDRRLFHSGIELTSVAATVTDAEGHPVLGLDREAFEVYEDGERQEVTQFTNERVPIGVGILLDVSDSMYGARIRDARVAVEHFLFERLSEEDEFFLMTFNHAPHVLTGWSHTPDVFQRALDAVHPSGGTAMYDAIVRALPILDARDRARAALLIISDGADTASDAKLRDVRSALARTEAFVYAIAIDPPETRPINRGVDLGTLRNITGESGGRTEVAHSSAEIDEAGARIAAELNNQYVLGYTSTHAGDGEYRTIRVRVAGSDHRVRTRRGYVSTPLGPAPRPTPPPPR